MTATATIRSALEARFPGTCFRVSWDRQQYWFVVRWWNGPEYDDVRRFANQIEEDKIGVRYFKQIYCIREE